DAPGIARPRDARDAICERLARVGAGGTEGRAGEPRHGRGARDRQGIEGAAHAAGRGCDRLDRALPPRSAAAAAARAQVGRALRHFARRAHDAPGVLGAHQAPRESRGRAPSDLAAHAAACVRHAPHQPRRGPARRAAAAGTRRHLHHADLHARGARAPEGPAPQAPSARMIDVANLSPWLLVVAPIVVIVAYTVFGLSGFGSTLITVPILAHFLPVTYLVPLMAALDLVSAITIGASSRKHVSKPELKRLIPFMFVGILLGATVLAGVSDRALRAAVGLFALTVGMYALVNPAMHRVIS